MSDTLEIVQETTQIIEVAGLQGPQGPSGLFSNGGALNADAVLTASTTADGTGKSTDSEMGGWGFGVEEKLDGVNTGKSAYFEPEGFYAGDGSSNTHLSSTALTLDNGAKLRKGTTDAQNGGYKGVALECSAAYELKWEAGRLYVMEQNGFTIRRVEHCGTTSPTANDDELKGFVIGSKWLTDDGTVHTCTDNTEANAIWVAGISNLVVSGTDTGGGQYPDIRLKGKTFFGNANGSIGAVAEGGAAFGPSGFNFTGCNETVSAYNSFCFTALYGPQLWLDTSGKVGVGTSYPEETLDVSGNLILRDNSNGTKATFSVQGGLLYDRTFSLPDKSGTFALTSEVLAWPVNATRDHAGKYFYKPQTFTAVQKSSGITNLMTITTQNAHGYASGDIVVVSGLQTTSGAVHSLNGTYEILDTPTATTFRLLPNNNAALATLNGTTPKQSVLLNLHGTVGDLEHGEDESLSSGTVISGGRYFFRCSNTVTNTSVISRYGSPTTVISRLWQKSAFPAFSSLY